MPNLDWEDEDVPDGVDPKNAPVLVTKVEPGWTSRLAHVDRRTVIEQQASDLKAAIEALGGHPMLTDALNAADLAMRTLGKWHDEGEPGAAS